MTIRQRLLSQLKCLLTDRSRRIPPPLRGCRSYAPCGSAGSKVIALGGLLDGAGWCRSGLGKGGHRRALNRSIDRPTFAPRPAPSLMRRRSACRSSPSLERAPSHRHLWRARDAARAARDLSGERARGARAALTADPLALQRRGERAAGPRPRRRRGRRAGARRRRRNVPMAWFLREAAVHARSRLQKCKGQKHQQASVSPDPSSHTHTHPVSPDPSSHHKEHKRETCRAVSCLLG